MNLYLALSHSLELIVINRSDIIEHPFLHCCPGRLLERLRNMKKVIGQVGLHLQIFGRVAVTTPGHKNNKGKHHSIKQAEGIEDDGSDFMVLLQYLRGIFLSYQVKACESKRGSDGRHDEK